MKHFVLPGKPYRRPTEYASTCHICKRDVDLVIEDGDWGLCSDCARHESNRIYDNLIRIYDKEEKLSKMAFSLYGIDDFAYCVDEELR